MGVVSEQAPALPPSQSVLTGELHFDHRNPRLFLEQDLTEQELILRLWRDFAVDEVALSIAHNGYFPHEPLFAATEDERLVVIEGNRRLAAVRILIDDELRQQLRATDLPDISQRRREELKKLPVIKCQRSEVWQYIGFKHVNGPQPWQSYAKAKYVAWVHNELGTPLSEIAIMIGDRHATVRRLYRGLMVLNQAENSGVFNRDDRWKNHFSFSHLYTGLDYSEIQDFLGIDNDSSFIANPIPKDKVNNLGELCKWLYGRKSTGTEQLVRSQNPDLRNLAKAIGHEGSLAALRTGLPLNVAVDISIGDEKLFKGHLVEARYRLQEARGKQLTGDTGDTDLLRAANDILDLADRLVMEMEEQRREERSNRRDRRHTTV